MRSASGALITLLNTGNQFCVADLLTIIQADGTTTRLTSADVDVTAVSQVDSASHVFSSSGPPFTRDRTKLIVGLEIDSMTITLLPDPLVHALGGVPWPAAAAAGALDEARIVLERAFMATWGDTSAGTLIQFAGRVGKVTPSRSSLTLEVNSDLELLRAGMPRNTYQPGCVHTLFDSGCGLARASFAVAATALAGSTRNLLNLTDGHATGYFDLGTVTFTSGANAGKSYTVKSWTSGGSLVPTQAFAAAPAAGDTCTLYPGCDKIGVDWADAAHTIPVYNTCRLKFNNLARFRGFPFVPAAENAR